VMVHGVRRPRDARAASADLTARSHRDALGSHTAQAIAPRFYVFRWAPRPELGALPSFAQDTPPQVPAAAVEAPAAKPQDRDSIAARLSRVEQKLADLQALVGAFVRSNPGAMPPQDTGAGAPAGDPPSSQGELGMRVAALETQIGALTAQLEQIECAQCG